MYSLNFGLNFLKSGYLRKSHYQPQSIPHRCYILPKSLGTLQRNKFVQYVVLSADPGSRHILRCYERQFPQRRSTQSWDKEAWLAFRQSCSSRCNKLMDVELQISHELPIVSRQGLLPI